MSNRPKAEEEFTTNLTSSLDVSLLSDDYEIEQDVAGDLEIFVQLVNVGHFDRAMSYFDRHLAAYRESFPVAAEYTQALIDQEDFGRADKFLSHMAVTGSLSSKEIKALSLMHALVRMHTRMECAEALKLAMATFPARETGQLARLDVLDMQILILCLRIADESIRAPSNQSIIELSRTFLSDMSRSIGGPREKIEHTIEMLCEGQRSWAARVLLDIFVRNLAPIDWIEQKSVSFLRRLFTLIPEQHDPEVSLAKLFMITDLCFNVITPGPDGRIPQIHGIEALLDDNIWASERPENFLEAVDTKLCETRQYDHLLFLGHVVDPESPIHPLVSAVQFFVCRKSYRGNHEISFQEHLALVHCNQFNHLDPQRVFGELRYHRDRLSYYRFMKALCHVSTTAASIAEQPFDTDWGDIDTNSEKVQHVAAETRGNWIYDYISRLAKIMILCKGPCTRLLPGSDTILDGIVLAHNAFRECMMLLRSEFIPAESSLRKPLQAIEREAERLLLLMSRASEDGDWQTKSTSNMKSIFAMLHQLTLKCPQLSMAVDMDLMARIPPMFAQTAVKDGGIATFGDGIGTGAGKAALGAGHRYEGPYHTTVYRPGAVASFGYGSDMPDIFADSNSDLGYSSG